MKRFLVFCVALQTLLPVLSAAPAKPMNDGISNTILLPEIEGSYENVGGGSATAEFGETNVGGAAAKHTVWYKYTAPYAGRFIVEIKDEQGLRAELRLPGNPANTIPLQTFADGTSNTIFPDEEKLSADLTRGQTIYLVVDAEKAFNFSWRFVQVVNDTYKEAETLIGASGTVKRADKGATLSPYEKGLGFDAPAIWFQWTATSSGNYFLDGVGSRDRSSQVFGKCFIYLYDSVNGTPGTLRGTSAGNGLGIGTLLSFNATAGQVYYIAVHGFATNPDNQIWLSWYPSGAPAKLEWATTETYVTEADGKAFVKILQLYGGFGVSGNVNVVAAPGGPYAPATGNDFQVSGLPIGFGNSNRYQEVSVVINDDFDGEPRESFNLGLVNASGNQTITDGTSNTIIIGEDPTGDRCGLVSREAYAREGSSAWLELRRLSPGTNQITVGWKVLHDGTATPAVDLPELSGIATIDSGALSTFIEIPIYQDGVFEGREYFNVRLSDDATSGSIVDGTSNTIVFVEDDDYFVPRAGKYCGVVDTNGWGALVKYTLSNGGTATGTVDYQGVRYPFRGAFDAEGALTVPLQRGNRVPLGLRVRFHEGWNACDVSVRDPEGEWADGSVRLLPYNGKTAIAPQAGQYTVVCDSEGTVDTPFIVTGTAKTDGSVRFVGRMADNTPVSFGGNVALGDGSVRSIGEEPPRGEVAFCAPLYGNKGNFYGSFELGLGPQLPGGESQQWWLKPWRPKDAILPALEFQTSFASCVRYTPPAAGQRITASFQASLGDGSVRFVGGGTALDGTSNTILIGEANRVTVTPDNCSIQINPKNGTFTGRITPTGGTPTTFFGCFAQGAYGYGIGYYLGNGTAGSVVIEADK